MAASMVLPRLRSFDRIFSSVVNKSWSLSSTQTTPPGVEPMTFTQSRGYARVKRPTVMSKKALLKQAEEQRKVDAEREKVVGKEVPVDMAMVLPGFENIPALKDSDNEDLKRLFSLEFGTGRDILQKKYDIVTRMFQEHPLDHESPVVKVAKLTVKVRNLQDHVARLKKETRGKRLLNDLMQRRQKSLKDLRALDYDTYCHLLVGMGLVHEVKPPAPGFRETRKMKMTREVMEQAEKQRLDYVRKRLEDQRMREQEEEARRPTFINE